MGGCLGGWVPGWVGCVRARAYARTHLTRVHEGIYAACVSTKRRCTLVRVGDCNQKSALALGSMARLSWNRSGKLVSFPFSYLSTINFGKHSVRALELRRQAEWLQALWLVAPRLRLD